MQTLSELQQWFECDEETAKELDAIQKAGYSHGVAGYYPDGDFSSDADWCYGVGERIATLEKYLGIDDGAVFDLYAEAHAGAFTHIED